MPGLVTTGVAAREIGVKHRTLLGWVERKLITPARVTPGGHLRWNVDNLGRQIAELRDRNDDRA